MQKTVYDMRGKPTNISRLASYDAEGFIHMVFYRIAIFVAAAYGILLLLWYVVPGMGFEVKVATAIMWILFTPQLFETAKGISLTQSGGMAFGHLNEEYKRSTRTKYHPIGGVLTAVPYLAILLWAFGFVVMLYWWSI